MNDEMFNNDIDYELSPEEASAIDRILYETAKYEDGKVDYSAMLRDIKARAKKEGIVIFPSQRTKKRAALARRIAAGVATAAAVFVLGFAVMSVVNNAKAGGKVSISDQIAANEPAVTQTGDKIVNTAKAPTKTTEVPVQSNSDVAETFTSAPVMTKEPVSEHSDMPVFTPEPEISPFPSEFPMRGGTIGYIELDAMDGVLTSDNAPVPEGLPECMSIKRINGVELGAYAAGEQDGKAYSYTCIVLHDVESDLSIGVARYKLTEDSDKVSYLWRISEDTYLDIEFTGFDKAEADEFLISLANITIEPAA